jgi:tryptophanyl-tRNA synthetase
VRSSSGTLSGNQVADIFSCEGSVVPVGKDNIARGELARLFTRRFNDR